MHELSPREQLMVWDITKLRVPDITFLTVWDEDILLSCGA